MTGLVTAAAMSPGRVMPLDEESHWLQRSAWHARRQAHEQRVDAWIGPRNLRKSKGEKHPVYDFLFEYYSQRPSALRRWHPGLDVRLEVECGDDFIGRAGYVLQEDRWTIVDPESLKPERRAFVFWLLQMLEASGERPGYFGCSGLHEWAMVYAAGPQRHHEWPLRLSQAETDAVVRSQTIRCSHFDAFRFFTPQAKPMNRLQPQRTTSADFEQPACLHAQMDLYKWAYKLAPFTRSELVADAFAFAMEIREVDMRASPYDFSSLGFESIRIESPDGRAEFERYQRDFATRAVPIRAELIGVCRRLIGAWQAE